MSCGIDERFKCGRGERPITTTLWYNTKNRDDITAYQCEVFVPETKDPPNTYYCACGFSRGYLGMQVNSCDSERRILFSVWDDAKGGVVETIAAHPGARVKAFGGEGEGMHSILWHPWKTASWQKFKVTADPEPEKGATVYSGYFYLDAKWLLIGSFRAPSDGKYLRGLYSFCENFGQDFSQERQCLYRNLSVQLGEDNKWMGLRQVKCTTSPGPEGDYFDFRIQDGCFCLTINGDKATTVGSHNPDFLTLPHGSCSVPD